MSAEVHSRLYQSMLRAGEFAIDHPRVTSPLVIANAYLVGDMALTFGADTTTVALTALLSTIGPAGMGLMIDNMEESRKFARPGYKIGAAATIGYALAFARNLL